MPVRRASALWEGGLKGGKGSVSIGTGAFVGKYSFASRFEQGPGTNPEELLGAAHAACFSMALAMILEQAGYKPERVHTSARVSIDKAGEGFKITSIELDTEVRAAGLDEKTFRDKAETAKEGCPVSVALGGGVPIKLLARLAKPLAA